MGRSRDGLAGERQVSLRCDPRRCPAAPATDGRSSSGSHHRGREETCHTKIPGKERACARRRYKRITAERTARGMCPRCGKAKPVPDSTLCRPCGEKRRKAERARHAKARAAGMLYAGRDAERCRRSASDRSKRRNRARKKAGLCTRCGKHQPVEGGTVCEPCREMRREKEREQHAARRAAGQCGRCGAPASDGSARCERCARSAAKPSRKKAKDYASYCTSLVPSGANSGGRCRCHRPRCLVGGCSGSSYRQRPSSL